ncbi:MAG: substrate-binding domain-containing protein [Chthoniobacteraceae bacterium]
MSHRVAVILHQTIPWMAQCTAGIRRYAREVGRWHLLVMPPGFRRFGYAPTFPDLHQWKGDGIIGLVDDEAELRTAAESKMPVVNLGAWLPESFGVPRVMVDHYQGGQLAAGHLLGLGLRRLAVFGWSDAWYLNQRTAGFQERAAQAGIKCELLLTPSREDAARSWHQRIAVAARWLATLPKPCGVFGLHDYMAQLIAEACHEANLRIPDEIALIGMDNDETICEHLAPPLSSVSRNPEQTGWEAAALLDRLMHGEPPPLKDTLIEPENVVARQSTNKLSCADPVVQQVLDEMKRTLHVPTNIEEIADRVGISKRTLEIRFRESLGSSPHHFFTKLRVRHAQALLRQPEHRTMEQLALEAGFGSIQSFRKAFQRVTGESLHSSRKRGVQQSAISLVA